MMMMMIHLFVVFIYYIHMYKCTFYIYQNVIQPPLESSVWYMVSFRSDYGQLTRCNYCH